jgi:hypothetical protein
MCTHTERFLCHQLSLDRQESVRKHLKTVASMQFQSQKWVTHLFHHQYTVIHLIFVCQVGCIRWPLQLCDNAADLEYTNDTIQTALHDAFSSIFDIIVGHQSHPIVDLFSSFMNRKRQEFRATHQNREPTTADLDKAALWLPFSVPILRGDASLADEFSVNLQCQLLQSSNRSSARDECPMIHISRILFHLVVLRTYLS